MAFTLTINNEDIKLNTTVINNPTSIDIGKAINILKQNPDNFIILESNPPIDTFTFIQVSSFENNEFRTEIEYKEDNTSYMYYHYIQSENELLELLLNFISNIAPNINDWDYFDDFEEYKFYKEYELRKFLKNNGLIIFRSKNIPENTVKLDTSDIQIFLKYIKERNIKAVFYCYDCADRRPFDISNINGRDNDLLKIAEDEINSYMKKIAEIDFDQPAILELFCIDNGVIISMQVIAPWLTEIMPASKFFDFLKEKFEKDLTRVKSNRINKRDAILEELRTILLNNSDFALCTNQNLRRDFIRRFLRLNENEKYRQAFLDEAGYIDLNATQRFVDIVYAVYKQMKNK